MGSSSVDKWKKLSRHVWFSLGVSVAFLLAIFIISVVLVSRSTRDQMQAAPLAKMCLSLSNGLTYPIPTSDNAKLLSSPIPFNKSPLDKHDRYDNGTYKYSIYEDGPFQMRLHLSLQLDESETVVALWKNSDDKTRTISTWHLSGAAPSGQPQYQSFDFSTVSDFEENDILFATVQTNSSDTSLVGTFDCGSNYLEIYDLRL